MAALRKARGVKKRECTSCKRSDELNNRYCIFCGAEIQKRQMSVGNSEALEKFTMEVSSVQDRRALLDKVEAHRVPDAVNKTDKHLSMPAAAALYAGLGLLTALGVTALSPINFGQSMLALTSPIKEGLILYTSEPFVNVVLESSDKKRYLLGSTGQGKSLALNDLAPGSYLARFSKPGFETRSQAVDIQKGQLNLLGFDTPVKLSRSLGENSQTAGDTSTNSDPDHGSSSSQGSAEAPVDAASSSTSPSSSSSSSSDAPSAASGDANSSTSQAPDQSPGAVTPTGTASGSGLATKDSTDSANSAAESQNAGGKP